MTSLQNTSLQNVILVLKASWLTGSKIFDKYDQAANINSI